MEHAGLSPRALHDISNWFVLTNWSNNYNVVNRKVVLQEVVNFGPARTPFVAECYGARLADVLFWVDFGETRAIAYSSGVKHVGGYGASDVLPCVDVGTEALPRRV